MPDRFLESLTMEELQHPEARWLIAYWNSKTPAEGVPTCGSLVAQEIRAVAPHLIALKPSGIDGELQYRRVGSAITSRFGIDLTGSTLSTDSAGGWAPAMLRAASERRPAALRGRVPGGRKNWVRFEALALPVVCRDSEGTGVVAGLFFFDE